MLIRKAYKFRLNTNTETEQLMSQYAGNCRFLCNKVLVMNLFKLENKPRLFTMMSLIGFPSFGKRVKSTAS